MRFPAPTGAGVGAADDGYWPWTAGHAGHPARSDPIHLLAVLDHATSIVIAQVNVDVKTNEIPCLKTVLNPIKDLKDVLITADAPHCQTAHITYLWFAPAGERTCWSARKATSPACSND